MFYDPLIAKLVVHGPTRIEALRILRNALSQYQVVGPHTNIPFLRSLASHPAFINAEVETGFIEKYRKDLFPSKEDPRFEEFVKVGVWKVLSEVEKVGNNGSEGPWKDKSLWGRRFAGGNGSVKYEFEEALTASSEQIPRKGKVEVQISNTEAQMIGKEPKFDVSVWDFNQNSVTIPSISANLDSDGKGLKTEIGSILENSSIVYHPPGSTIQSPKVHIFSSTSISPEPTTFAIPVPSFLSSKDSSPASTGQMKTPMPCRIVTMLVKEGERVKEGQGLVVLEAMKTETILRSPGEGVVVEVRGGEGKMCEEGETVVRVELDSEKETEK